MYVNFWYNTAKLSKMEKILIQLIFCWLMRTVNRLEMKKSSFQRGGVTPIEIYTLICDTMLTILRKSREIF